MLCCSNPATSKQIFFIKLLMIFLEDKFWHFIDIVQVEFREKKYGKKYLISGLLKDDSNKVPSIKFREKKKRKK